jgi:ribosomal-protein-alanine N-acetyltransferase
MPLLVSPTVSVGSLAARPQPALSAGDSVLLRPWESRDAQAVLDAYQDAEIQRWHVRRAVVDSASDVLLGRAALKVLNFADGTAEVAYWTVPAARGRGICPQAVEAMSSWALDVAGFERLGLQHSMGNRASCRVAEKTGFTEEGVRRSAWLHADGRHDVHMHARLRSPARAEP